MIIVYMCTVCSIHKSMIYSTSCGSIDALIEKNACIANQLISYICLREWMDSQWIAHAEEFLPQM